MYPQMSSLNSSRKRPAPDTSPIVPMPVPPMQQQQQQQYTAAGQQDQLLRWNTPAPDGGAMYDAAARNVVNPYMMSSTGVPAGQFAPGPTPAAPSTALARRGMGSRALVHAAPRQIFDSATEVWNTFGDDFQQQQPQNPTEDHESMEALEERALRAKREATMKRKQIPPFVQKLRSFLDESKNTELIRWSDSGDSFIVLDEDEFAKKLIPELFKHNNYASFVRQLNMYGFHKRVGLSDNSMKASERKNKSPSEYYNPYFKRGHPTLLWLINKPKSGGKKKEKKEGEIDSEDENLVEETYTQQQPSFAAPINQIRNVPAIEVGPLPPKKDLVLLKTQIEKLQQQQVAISQIIDRIRREHRQLMDQAAVFQDQHGRHENSINAILNFLANVFRKSLEDPGGAQSVSELLASFVPGAQAQMPQGSVVDLGDFDAPRTQEASSVMTSPPKRQQRLLPPIPTQGGGGGGKAPTVSPSTTAASTPQPQYHNGPQMGSVTELFDASPSEPTTPAYFKNELQTNPHEGMMKIINDTNTNSGSSRLDLPDMASRTNATMSHEQRNKMLNMMAGRSSSTGIPVNPSSSSPQQQHQQQQHQQQHQQPNNNNPYNAPLSPLLSAGPPSQYQIQNAIKDLQALEQMQRDQAAEISDLSQAAESSDLSQYLGPLSPMRHVPGLDNPSNGYFDDLGVGDMDQYLDPGAFGDAVDYGDIAAATASNNNAPPSTDGNDFDFDVNGGGGGVVDFNGLNGAGAYEHNDPVHGGRIFGGDENSLQNTPSPAGTEEIPRDDLGSPDGPNKRRRVQ